MSIESMMPSNHHILCHPLLFFPSIFPSIRVFSSESALRIRYIGVWVSASASVLPGFPGGSESKVSACNAGDLRSIPGEGNGNLLQYSCLENPMDKGAWLATVHGVAKSQTRLSDFTFTISPSKEHSGLISFRMDWLLSPCCPVQGSPKVGHNWVTNTYYTYTWIFSKRWWKCFKIGCDNVCTCLWIYRKPLNHSPWHEGTCVVCRW